MKKIKHWIHSFHDTVMFKKNISPSSYRYIENIYYIKKAETALSRFCFFYYILKEL